ncbi:MAG: DUF4240 domain-containing protein, partial [Bacteroidota bacterium]
MNKDLLWRIIDESYDQGEGKIEKQVSTIAAKIGVFKREEIFQSAVIFYRELIKGYKEPLVFAGRLLNGFCAWSELDLFLAWIMSKGRANWAKVLENPDVGLSSIISI